MAYEYWKCYLSCACMPPFNFVAITFRFRVQVSNLIFIWNAACVYLIIFCLNGHSLFFDWDELTWVYTNIDMKCIAAAHANPLYTITYRWERLLQSECVSAQPLRLTWARRWVDHVALICICYHVIYWSVFSFFLHFINWMWKWRREILYDLQEINEKQR